MGPKPAPLKKESKNSLSPDKCFLGWCASNERFLVRKKEDVVSFEAPGSRFLWVYLLNFLLFCLFFFLGFYGNQDPSQRLMWACRAISVYILIGRLLLPTFGAVYSAFFQKPKVILDIQGQRLAFFHGVRKVADFNLDKVCSIEVRKFTVKMWKPRDHDIPINGVFVTLGDGQGFFLAGAFKKEEVLRILEELRSFFPKAKVA